MSIASIAFLVLVVASFGGFAVSLLAVYLYSEAWKEDPTAPAEKPLSLAPQTDMADAETLLRAA